MGQDRLEKVRLGEGLVTLDKEMLGYIVMCTCLGTISISIFCRSTFWMPAKIAVPNGETLVTFFSLFHSLPPSLTHDNCLKCFLNGLGGHRNRLRNLLRSSGFESRRGVKHILVQSER
jgi:hypothetical protein